LEPSGFWSFWQHIPENIDPVIFEIGVFKIQYYGLMYIVAFAITYFLAAYRVEHEKRFSITVEQVKEMTVNMLLGLVIGARIGYVLFYNFSYYLDHPLEIVLPFQFGNGVEFVGISGMSYHGGLIGVLIVSGLYVRKYRLDYRETCDLFAPVIPLGYTFGRLGNFINGELYGRVTTAPIGMYFPLATGTGRRHPSQLYEAFFEGIFLFTVLWFLRKQKMPKGATLAIYLIGYGLVRLMIEFFRQPDAHLGFVFLTFSMGQLLCSAMIAGGTLLYFYLWKKDTSEK
jgi:phosphatidylglycerol---prolipoprotein diacylglyceryl transferase